MLLLPAIQKRPEKNRKRRKRKFESSTHFWNWQTRVNVLDYPVNERSDFVFSEALEANFTQQQIVDNLRDHAQVVLNRSKLFPLIDRAVIEQGVAPT